ncbi:MAG TPA: hypothetical protein PKJ26_04845 [Candidatus Woesebacteria bacterium]|nr:hypothetical protein [Candidatus Woesebacteria bacterium]HNS65793.1 hypothetical protein [Candidatus Woesebacteria bacterium]
MANTYHTPQLAEIVIDLIAQHIGSDPISIELIADLEEDLGLLDQDISQILTLINRQYEELHLTLGELETNEVHTVGDLIQLIDDELAFA